MTANYDVTTKSNKRLTFMLNIGICGFGFVGQAVYGSLNEQGREACIIHDPPQQLDNFDKLLQCDVVFCCLPTPDKDGKQDFSYYEKFLNKLVDAKFTGILIIKSTLLYKNIKSRIKELKIVMNPEFLTANNNYEDFKNQKVIILGGRRDHCQIAADVYQKYFSLQHYFIEFCSIKEAIEIKYFHNIYHAFKVLFWNFVYEQSGNHRKMANLYKKIVPQGNEMDKVAADGKLGYSGSCFPKDVAAFEEERPHELTKFMIEYNKRLRNGK